MRLLLLLLVVGYWLLVVGRWLLVVCVFLLIVCWMLAACLLRFVV